MKPLIMADFITEVSQIIQRDDGSQVRIKVQSYGLLGSEKSIGFDVWHRKSEALEWILCNREPCENWRNISVEEYIKGGRPEIFQKASHAEILKLASLIGKPLE